MEHNRQPRNTLENWKYTAKYYKKNNIVLGIMLAITVVALIATATTAIQQAEANAKWRYFAKQACEYANGRYSYGLMKTSCDVGIDAVEGMSRGDIKELYDSMR